MLQAIQSFFNTMWQRVQQLFNKQDDNQPNYKEITHQNTEKENEEASHSQQTSESEGKLLKITSLKTERRLAEILGLGSSQPIVPNFQLKYDIEKSIYQESRSVLF